MFYEEASDPEADLETQLSANGGDQTSQVDEINFPEEEAGSDLVHKKSTSLRMDDFFPLKKIIRPPIANAEEVERRRKVADDKVTAMMSKFSRKRRIKRRNVTESGKQRNVDLETSLQFGNELLLDTDIPDSQMNENENLGFLTPDGKTSLREDVDGSSYTKDISLSTSKDSSIPSLSSQYDRTVYTKDLSLSTNKESSIPSLSAQYDRIAKIKRYDASHGTCHATVVKATAAGIQCEICEGTYIDLSSFFRLNRATNQIEKHTHIGSLTHLSNIATRKRLASRQPSLFTLLEDINPTVDRKVIAFRFEVVKLLLSLRVPLATINREIFRDFVSHNIG